MFRQKAVLDATREYLRKHPEEIGRAVRSAFGLRVGVPLATLRWLGRELEAKGKVQNLEIDSVPPGIRVAADLALMRTPIRASAVVFVERVSVTGDEMVVGLRLEGVSLLVLGDAQTPVAALIRSGALDLSRPGNLARHLPNLPPVIAEAKDNRLTIDLMRDARLGDNPLVRRALGVLTSFVTLHGVESDQSHVDVAFRALPTGLFGAARAVRRHVVGPSLKLLTK